MDHPLEAQYGLTAHELLDAVNKRFRLKVALEGAVAEVQMEKKIQPLVGNAIERYEAHDLDGHPDFSLWIPAREKPVRAKCKNVRDRDQAYRDKGQIVAYMVETQKTRASRGDPTSRYYGVDQFDILGVCLGKKTGNWSDFLFARVVDLLQHARHKGKLAVMQRVPLPDAEGLAPWYNDLGELLRNINAAPCSQNRSTKRN